MVEFAWWDLDYATAFGLLMTSISFSQSRVCYGCKVKGVGDAKLNDSPEDEWYLTDYPSFLIKPEEG